MELHSNKKGPKFKVGDYDRISLLLNYILQIGQKKFLLLVKFKTQFLGLVINDLNGQEFTGSFYEKELRKTNQKEFRIEKVIRRKGDKLYVKWKGHYDHFN